MSSIRREDADALAGLHARAFPSFFLSSLGVPFLRQFYLGFVGDPTAVTVVARDGGTPVGCVVGTIEPKGFFTRLLRRRLLGFGVASARAAVTRPRSIRRLLRGLLYRGGADHAPTGGALLSSICVDPARRDVGLGADLISRWSELAAAMGASTAYLTTDAIDNEAVNRFYQRAGWTLAGTASTPEGRSMHTYTVTLPTGASN